MPRKSPYLIELTADEERFLQAASRKYTSLYRDVMRAKVVLLATGGMENKEIAECLLLPRQIVSKWRKRFFYERLVGLQDRPRRGRPRTFSP